MTDEQRESKIRALVKERDGYLVHGRTDRAAEVDVELKLLGAQGSAPSKRASKRGAKEDG